MYKSEAHSYTKYIVIATSCAFMIGCTLNKAKHTSGIIGCPESSIKIMESSGGFTANTWTAQCDGKTFYCTYAGMGNVTCKESIIGK